MPKLEKKNCRTGPEPKFEFFFREGPGSGPILKFPFGLGQAWAEFWIYFFRDEFFIFTSSPGQAENAGMRAMPEFEKKRPMQTSNMTLCTEPALWLFAFSENNFLMFRATKGFFLPVIYRFSYVSIHRLVNCTEKCLHVKTRKSLIIPLRFFRTFVGVHYIHIYSYSSLLFSIYIYLIYH